MADRRMVPRVVAGLSGLPRAFMEASDPADETDAGSAPTVVAFEKGLLEGREAGAAEATEVCRRECDALRQAISETVRSLVDLRTRMTQQHGQAMFDLALSAASCMLRGSIDRGDPVASRALEEALAALPGSGPVVARLHPDDIESIRRDLAKELESGRVALTADDAISRGGCIVESDAGTINATVETAEEVVIEAASGTGAS